jgi:hypothetical protein
VEFYRQLDWSVQAPKQNGWHPSWRFGDFRLTIWLHADCNHDGTYYLTCYVFQDTRLSTMNGKSEVQSRTSQRPLIIMMVVGL